jgi:hypothetical protein
VFRISFTLMLGSFNELKFKLMEVCVVIICLKTVPNFYPFIQSNASSLASHESENVCKFLLLAKFEVLHFSQIFLPNV